MRTYPEYKDSGVEGLGGIPSHWGVYNLKHVTQFAYGDSLSKEIRADGKVPVFGSNGVVGYHDEAITKSPCIIIGRKGSFGKVNFSDVECFPIDTTYFIDERATKNNLRWLYYLLLSHRLDAFSKDSAVPGLSREDAYQRRTVLPPLSEQQAIADFLDGKTAQIDTLIEKKQQQIGLLQEQRTALINHAVTKGLNPDAPMKDSGVEWLGEIPNHWKVLSLKRVVIKFVDYRGHTPVKTDSGVLLITAKNIRNGYLDFEKSKEYIAEDNYETWMVRGMPEKGDVMVTTEAPLGATAQIEEEYVALAQRLILLKADKEQVDNSFLKYYFLSKFGQDELYSQSTGSTAIGIKASKFYNISIVVPPLKEQQEIAEYLANEEGKISSLIKKIEEIISFLQEYRTALISEAVTGKIDVREWRTVHE